MRHNSRKRDTPRAPSISAASNTGGPPPIARMMSLRFDLADLQAFVKVSELRSFRRAADAVAISQPALSRRIDKLESALGVRLLDRSTRKVEVTAIGREFAQTARQLMDDLDSAMLSIREVGATRAGEVKIACVPSAAYYYLPAVLREFRQRFPRIRVRVFDAGASEVLVSVARAECDFGINFIGGNEPDIDFLPLFNERFVAACRKDHPLARKRRITWKELTHHEYMTVAKNSGNRLLIDQALAQSDVRPASLVETQHITTLLGMVEAGLGVAAVPSLAMPAKDHPVLASVPLVEPEVKRRVGIIRRRGRTLSPAAQELFELMQSLKRRVH